MADEMPETPDGADTPTEVMPEVVASADGDEAAPKKMSGLTLALLIALGVLLIGIIVLLILLLLPRESGAPSPLPTPTESTSASMEPTPSATPSETPTPTPTPTPTSSPSTTSKPVEPSGPDGTITSFSGPSSAGCLSSDAPAFQSTVDVTFNWTAQNVSQVAFGVATNDAINEPYENGLPPSGSITVGFPCDLSKQKYTLTVAGADGVHVSKSVTVNNPSA